MQGNESIIQALETYFLGCDLLSDGAFRVDYLGIAPVEYSIDVMPVDPIIKKYADGSPVRQYLFAFSSREYYSQDRLRNIENSAFYERLSDWCEAHSKSRDLPALPSGLEAQKLEVASSGYLFDAKMKSARYQIQLRLIYFKEAF